MEFLSERVRPMNERPPNLQTDSDDDDAASGACSSRCTPLANRDKAMAELEEAMKALSPPLTPSEFARSVSQGEDGKQINPMLDERDRYWRRRIEAELKLATHRIDNHWRNQLMEERAQIQEQLDADIARRAALESLEQSTEEEIATLRLNNAELRRELETGKKMIEQFSSLMADKAKQVCQYCRAPASPTAGRDVS